MRIESESTKFIVDPSINLDADFKDLIQDLKIKVISYQEHKEVLQNLFRLMMKYLNKELVKDILERAIDKQQIRELYLNLLLDSE